MTKSYPEPPWTLRGRAVAFPLLLRRDLVAMPAPLEPLSFGGRVPGVAIVAWYGPGSSLEYHELAVLAAARCGGRVGASVLELRVDDPASEAGGREVWGLDKRLAAFDWAAAGRSETVRVGDGAEFRFTARFRHLFGRALPIPAVPLRAFVAREGRPYAFAVRVSGRVRPVRLEEEGIVAWSHAPRGIGEAVDPETTPRAARPGHARSGEPRTGIRLAGLPRLGPGFGLAFERLHARVDAPRPI